MRLFTLELESLQVNSFTVDPEPFGPVFQQAMPSADAGCGGSTDCGGGQLPTFDVSCLNRTIGGTGTC